jgi:hypothetical protein
MAVTSTGKTPPEVERANRMFAIDNAVKLGDLSKKQEILDFISAGPPLEEEAETKRSITGFHTSPQYPG